MATYQITANGQTFEVTAPNEQQALAALQSMLGGQGQPQEPQMGSLEAFGRGAVRGFADLGRGAVGFATGGRGLPGMTPDLPPEAMAEYAQVQQQHPLATGIGESLPYIGASVATGGAMGPAGLVAGMAAQGLTAGAVGASMPGSLGERAVRGAVDAGVGMVGEGVGRAVGRMVAPQLFPANADRVIANAEKLGYKVLPSTRAQGGAGQPIANVVEGSLEVIPGSSSVMARAAQHNQSLLNKEAVKALGENAEKFPGVTDKVLGNARKRIGSEFERLMSRDLRVHPEPIDLALTIEETAPYLVGPADPVGTILSRLENLVNKHPDGIPANVLESHISKLGKVGTAKMRTDPDLGHAIMDVRTYLMNAVQEAMSPTEREAYRRAREQYRILSALESGHVTNPVSGDVSAAHLASFLSRRDKAGFLEGGNQSPLYEGARFLGRLQRPKATSGTAERLTGVGAITGIPTGVGAVLGGEDDRAMGALKGAGVGLALAYGGARGLLSKPMASGFFTRAPGAAEKLATKMGGQLTARMALGDLPENLLGPLEGTEWGKKFMDDPMRPDRMTPEVLRRRLALLTKGAKLTPEQKAAVTELETLLKSHEGR